MSHSSSPLGPRPSSLGPDQTKGLIHVAAAALVNAKGEILLARRHDDAHQGGLWEFPGGKLEPGETVAAGLVRELAEELGVAVQRHRPLIRVRHRYPDREVLLDIHRVDDWRDEPHGREGQPIAWVAPDRLTDYPMPAADVPIVRALQLPDRYLLTPPRVEDTEVLLNAVHRVLDDGVRLIQLRVFDLAERELVALGRELCALCHAQGAQVLLNGSVEQATAMGADGVHLNRRALMQSASRPECSGWVAASCHSPAELAHAQAIGVDFAVLSPVLATPSHPDADPLGWPRFAEWVDAVAIPVYALGGMHAGLRSTAWEQGAQGVAGIRGLWPA
jgi:8-oxo-dGTP diphosphatase